MKKSTYITIIAVLSAIAGALVAVAIYLNRREKDLEEYEQMLFGEEFNDEFSEEATDELASLEPDAEAPIAEGGEV